VNQYKTIRASRLQMTVLASLLVHTLVIISGWQPFKTINISTLSKGYAQFQISIIESPHPVSKASTEKNVQSVPQQSGKTNRADKHLIEEVVHDTDAQQDLAINTEATNQTENNPSSNIANNMIQYLETEFRTRFKYPLVARKRGWQGKVVVAIDVNKAGYIHNINIKQSSGHAILDNNALRTFEAIGNINSLKKDHHRDYKLSIPVIYKLTEG